MLCAVSQACKQRAVVRGLRRAWASEETRGIATWACCLEGRPSAAPAPATAADRTDSDLLDGRAGAAGRRHVNLQPKQVLIIRNPSAPHA